MSGWSKSWAFGLTCLLLVGASIAVIVAFEQRSAADRVVYALDDPYIHMAVARNLAQHGVFGVTRYQFSSSSSSPLYTLMLAAMYRVFGVRELIPLIVNLLAAVAALAIAWRALTDQLGRQSVVLGWSLALLFLAPMIPVIFTGMEHTLQLAITLLFLCASVSALAEEGRAGPPWMVYALSPLVTFIRYEGVFVVAVVCLLFALRRRFVPAVVLGSLGFLPLGIFGAYSMVQGSYPLPNPVLLQGVPGDSLSDLALYPFRWIINLVRASHLLSLVGVSALLWVAGLAHRSFWDRTRLSQFAFVAVAVLHEQFAKNGWFYRYEAYLVAIGLVTVAIGLKRAAVPAWFRVGIRSDAARRTVLAAMLVLFAYPLVLRGVDALLRTPRAMTNIYRQQYQMGLFLREFYPEGEVAANDIGAIHYLADLRSLDLWGLGSIEVLRARLTNRWTSARIEALSRQHGIRIAILYHGWFRGARALPADWIRVGAWRILDNVVCGADTVTFLATSPSEARALRRNLDAFSASLPDGVEARDYEIGPVAAGLR